MYNKVGKLPVPYLFDVLSLNLFIFDVVFRHVQLEVIPPRLSKTSKY